MGILAPISDCDGRRNQTWRERLSSRRSWTNGAGDKAPLHRPAHERLAAKIGQRNSSACCSKSRQSSAKETAAKCCQLCYVTANGLTYSASAVASMLTTRPTP
jgi:hypothetical protein